MTRKEKKEELIGLFSTGAIYLGDLIDECFEFGQQHPNWISVEDEMPEKRENVLVFTSQKSIQIAQVRYPETADWWDNDGRYMQNNKPTHWMSLPSIEEIRGNQGEISPNKKGCKQ